MDYLAPGEHFSLFCMAKWLIGFDRQKSSPNARFWAAEIEAGVLCDWLKFSSQRLD
jgi:hypothetical protein